ncbi:MAG: sigma-54 interaction domain-containing protein [Burkholderiales bacterium]
MSEIYALNGKTFDFPLPGADSVPKAMVFHQAPKLNRYGQLYGNSRPMKKLYQMIKKVAPTDATVLLVGESGTGKELVANTIHQMSPRKSKPFLAINCGAIPANLIEAELFGYERGSFTGANRMHRGYFERAHDGTLLLDEITEMTAELQVKLLRVLEAGSFTRVGGDQDIRVKVRVIAATNRQPQTAVAEGQLREDLMYRLSVFPIELPPLRDRAEDVELLARHFLECLNQEQGMEKRLSADALRILNNHAWPGNVRELQNVIQRAFILADDTVELDGLIKAAAPATPLVGNRLQFAVGTPLAEAERHMIFAALDHYDGNKKKTADALGLSLKTLYNRLSEYRGDDGADANYMGERLAS